MAKQEMVYQTYIDIFDKQEMKLIVLNFHDEIVISGVPKDL